MTNLKYTTITSVPAFHGVGDILGPTFHLFTKNIWLITKIVFVIVAPFEIFSAFSANDINNDLELAGGLFVLGLFCKILIAPALIYALMEVLETGKAPGLNESYRWGAGKMGKLILCALATYLLQALGYAFFIIPGIIIGLSLQLVYPIAVLEGGSVSEILRQSVEWTKGHRLNILAASLLLWIGIGSISLAAWGTAEAFRLMSGDYNVLYLVAAIVFDILEQSTTVLSLVMYLSIRRYIWESGGSVIK